MAATVSDRRGGRSHRRPPLAVVMERLEDRLLLSAASLDPPFLEGAAGSCALSEAPASAEIHKLIVAGDPNGTPLDSPANRVDPNTTGSLYAGVGSLRVDATDVDGYVYIGSATVISPTHVLTAAHMVDLDDNGTIDVAASDVTFNLNFGGNLTHRITAGALFVHPDWTGFGNPSINDDVAVIELSSPVPAGVPIYPLDTDPFEFIETATLVGYGLSGDGVNGYTVPASFSVKRVGFNNTDVYISDDEGSGSREGWEFDFDGPHKKTNLFGAPRGSNLTLGNDIETTLGGGDSGGPAFTDDGAGGLEIFGVNTFGFGSKAPAPLFGSGGGGIVVAAYAEWIQSVVGEIPGITVSPTAGLVTSEDGGEATFTVVLNTQPTADVTIGLSSSDASEGIVDQTSLTFTPSDWNVLQTVTVTGVDDGLVDGDVAYTIVTAEASSTDGQYNGLDAADVSVTNIDDEAPVETLAITKSTYSSRKVELKVEATSSLGGDAGLEATFFVGGVESARKAMSYSARKDKWSVTFNSEDGLGGTKPEKVRVYSASGAYVETADIGGKGRKSIPVATGRAIHAANATPEGIADSPVLPPWAAGTAASAADPQPADVSVSPAAADPAPLPTYTSPQQSPSPEPVDRVLGYLDDASADGGPAGELDLDLDALLLDAEVSDGPALLV